MLRQGRKLKSIHSERNQEMLSFTLSIKMGSSSNKDHSKLECRSPVSLPLHRLDGKDPRILN